MGANQSSDTNHEPDGGEVKTSYYELLGIEKTATDDEVKRAYRKKALELHPDRNYGDVERTTALFAEVQAAYEVLSDKHERAWYDAHEGGILAGGAGGTEAHFEHDMRITTTDDIARMLRKFHGKVDYSDSPSGFFGYLRDTFATLAREEEAAAASWEGMETVDYPSFGHRDDIYEDVVRPFYTVWGGFSTKKNFAWKDLYRYSEAPDRRVRRMMEKENKRLRDEGIREFNDAVRTLVAFVRKRDPRYTPNTQSEEQRSKAQRAAAAAQAARSRAVHEAKMQEAIPAWALKRDQEDELEEDTEESEEEHFECVACHKTFKSERQYEAHEKSKKHQKAVQALRKKMQKDNRHLNVDEDLAGDGTMTPTSQGAGDDIESFPKSNSSETGLPVVLPEGDSSGDAEEVVVGGIDQLDLHRSSKDSKSDNHLPLDEQALAPHVLSTNEDSDDQEEEADNYAPRSRVKDRLFDNEADTEATSSASEDFESHRPKTAKPGKAAQKRAKKAAKEAGANASDNKFRCVICNANFPSKTRLFQHIHDFGHAALKSEAGNRKSGKKR